MFFVHKAASSQVFCSEPCVAVVLHRFKPSFKCVVRFLFSFRYTHDPLLGCCLSEQLTSNAGSCLQSSKLFCGDQLPLLVCIILSSTSSQLRTAANNTPKLELVINVRSTKGFCPEELSAKDITQRINAFLKRNTTLV